LSAYAKLRSPAVNFYSFWDVYNQLCDAVESDSLARTTIVGSTFTRRGEGVSEDLDEQLPLSDLQPCVFGENGVPQAAGCGQLSGGRLSDEGTGTPPLPQASMPTHVHPEASFQVTYTDDEGDEIY